MNKNTNDLSRLKVGDGMSTELSQAEHNEVVEEISKIFPTVINQLVVLADKHNIERDDIVKEFDKIFFAMSEISTFKSWQSQNKG